MMNQKTRTFHDLSFEEKLTEIDRKIDSIKLNNEFIMDDEAREWLRQHIPT